MITIDYLLLLAVVQGITEFLPISSAAHLALLPQLSGHADQGLLIDAAAHGGSFIALCLLFAADVRRFVVDGWHTCRQRRFVGDGRLLMQLAVATVPAVIAGALFVDVVETALRHIEVIAWATIVFGIVLGVADWYGRHRTTATLSWPVMMAIGCAQAVALIPGVSRSGITMTAALFAGIDRRQAVRISFLLALPLLAAAVTLLSIRAVVAGAPVQWSAVMVTLVVSALLSYAVARLLLAWINRLGFWPFVVYRIVLGVALLVYFG